MNDKTFYLGLETGGAGFSLALSGGERENAGEIFIRSPQRQLVHLFPALKNLLAESEIEFAQIRGLGVAVGPGGYTGLRLGLITAKTLAQVLNVPIVGMNSLDLLAYNFLPGEGLAAPLFDARKGEVFGALYRVKGGKIERESDYWNLPPLEAARKLAEAEEPVALLGSGARLYAELFRRELPERALLLPPRFDNPRALHLAAWAQTEIEAGRGLSYQEIGPFYLRPPDALAPKITDPGLKSRTAP